MKHNNILRLAIASALSIGANTSYAGQLDIYHFDQTNNTVVNQAPIFDNEYFVGTNPTVPDGTDGGDGKDDLSSATLFSDFNDQYILSNYQLTPSGLSSGNNFLVKFELNNATFGKNIDTSSSPDFLFLTNPAVTTITSGISTGGNQGDSQVTFLIQPSGSEVVNSSDTSMRLRFTLTDASNALSQPGGTVELTARLLEETGTTELDTSVTKTVASSDYLCNLSSEPCVEAPANLTATAASQTQINLAWTDHSNEETGFKIEQPAGTLINTTAANATSYSHTGLTCETSYSYQVKATNGTADSTGVTASATTDACSTTTPTPSYKLTVESIGGTVTGEGINCGSDCQQFFERGTKVTLTATPYANTLFTNWGGDCDSDGTVIMGSDKSCTVTFTTQQTLTILPTEQGTISSQPEGLLCGPNDQQCESKFDSGTQITLAATPIDGWTFDGWEGEDCENVITLNQDMTCQPVFIDTPDSGTTDSGSTDSGASDTGADTGDSGTVNTDSGATDTGDSGTVNTDSGATETDSETPIETCFDATRLYVAQQATGNNTGCNWIDAMPELQTALTAISEGQFSNVEEIWLTKGTYKPGVNRTDSFQLMDGLEIYGGFAGDETSLSQHNPSENQTILTGDIGIEGDTSDNSYHVVTLKNSSGTTVLNDVIITAGNADGQGNDACGGGVLFDNSSPSLKHVFIRSNQAINGGGVCNINASRPLIKESVIDSNTAQQNGGGVFNDTQSSPTLNHVFITKNTAGNQGGGIMNQNGSNPVLSHTNVSSNTAAMGGGLVNDKSNPLISHSIFSDNTASEAGGMFNQNQSAPQLSHVIISGNAAEFAGAMLNQNSSPTLVQTTITENSAPQSSGFVNQAGSQTIINNSILWRNHYSLNTDGTVEPQIIDDANAQTVVNYSIVQGGFAGEGNLEADPLFAEPVEDHITTHTTVGDFHLSAGSPAIDAGKNELLPQDFGDAECALGTKGDGNTAEIVEIDFDGNPRIEDGNGDGSPQVDLGAYEAPLIQLVTYPLTVTITGEGSGTVSSNKVGISCGNDCSQNYQSGLEIMLIARADEGSQLTGWFGDCSGIDSDAEVDMTGPKSCQVQFDFIPEEPEPISEPEDPTTEIPESPTTETPTQTPEVEDETPTTGPLPPAVVVPGSSGCTASGSLNKVCNANGKVITDLVVHEDGDLSGGVIESELTNSGRVSNLVITQTGSVIGGIVTGLNKNQGLMSDFEFVGYSIDGLAENGEVKGRLKGQITNSSSLKNAFFKDVRLEKNTQIQGGIILKGHILGDEERPAILDGTIINTGTHVANVVIEKTVIIKQKATLENVTLQGLEVEQVTLSGRVQNTTSGIFRNVKLGPGAEISGGTFLGNIQGDATNKAKIEFAKIPAGTRLDNVRIGDDVILEEGVILGDGVEFINPPTDDSVIDSEEGSNTDNQENLPDEDTSGTSEETEPCKKGKSINLDSEQTVDSSACFAGKLDIGGKKANGAKLSKKEAKQLKVSMTIDILPVQVGQNANILMVGIYQAANGSSANYYRHGKNWQGWDGNVGSLTAAEDVNALPESLDVSIFEGDLSSMPGNFTVYVGIQLNDGTIHYNGVEPMQFEVE